MKSLKTIFLTKFLFIILISGSVYAQEFSLGADVVSRYIWRGQELGANSPSVQPSVEFSAGGFATGFWAALPMASPEANAEEIDFYLSYGFDLGNAGGLSLGITDYMLPNADGFQLTNFNNYDDTSEDGPGSHALELNVGYSGPESFPISLSFNVFFHGVEDSPIYVQLGYTTAVSDVGIDLFVGSAFGDGAAYYLTTETFDIVNLGITASKEIKITDSFSLPVFSSVITNPAAESLYFVFGVSL
ncbi:MAG: TorF family putative porin [Ignavibacteriaceae bacterium]